MEESSTYQAILTRGITRGREEGREEGRVDEARKMLILAGNGRLGKPTATSQALLESIDSVDALEKLMSRLFAVETWDDLLASIAD